jgi:hypothetical protein
LDLLADAADFNVAAVKLRDRKEKIPVFALGYAQRRLLHQVDRFEPGFGLVLDRANTPPALRLPLTWIGILYGRIRGSLAATSGLHGPEDVVKLLLVGTDVTMLCSTLLKNGISHLQHIEEGLMEWMEKHEYESVHQMKGSMSQIRCPNPSAFERAQYMKAVKSIQHVRLTGREAWRILSGT